MVTCPTCAAVLFVDMEGVAHAASDEPVSADAPLEIPAVEPAPSQSAEVFDLDAFQLPTENEPVSQGAGHPLPTFEPPFEAPTDAAAGAPINEQTPAQNNAPGESSVESISMEAFLGYESPGGSDGDSSQTDPNDPLGISAYANSELSSAKDGSLVVTVIISGIDTKDLRTEIRQALQDSRFGWDASAVMSTIRGGTLRLERISPVKATIVINRIKNLAVQIRWEQSAITELEISEPDSTT